MTFLSGTSLVMNECVRKGEDAMQWVAKSMPRLSCAFTESWLCVMFSIAVLYPPDIDEQCFICCKQATNAECVVVNRSLTIQDGAGCGRGFCLNVR